MSQRIIKLDDIVEGEDLQLKSNKTTALTGGSTDAEYPSAKTVYDADALKVDKVTNKSLVLDTEIAKIHTIGGDTTLGAMTADVNMNSHKMTGLSAPSANGDSIRATAKITEVLLENATDLIVVAFKDRGNFNASVNTYPTTGGSGVAGAIMRGDTWTISVVATSGTLIGLAVGVTVRSLIDNPGQTSTNWTFGGAAYAYSPENREQKNISGGYVGMTLFKHNLRNAANTFTSFLTNAATAVRTYTFPDKDITVAGLDDIVSLATVKADTDVASAISLKHIAGNDSTLKSPDLTKSINLDNAGVLHVESISQVGTAYETHAEQVLTTKDEIILRDGAVAGLATGAFVGIRAKLYDGVNDGLLVFDKDGYARVGDAGSLLKIATIQETPTDSQFTYYDVATLSLKTRVIALSHLPSGLVLTDQTTPQTIGLTGARLTKLWATDGEFTNMPTVGGTSLNSVFLPLSGGTLTGAVEFNTNHLNFNQAGIRSWDIYAGGGNFNIIDDDGVGQFKFNNYNVYHSGNLDPTTFAPASGSANYIQNQNASAQSANMWINGVIKVNYAGIGSATYAPNGNLGNNLLQIKSSGGYAYLTIGNGDTANSTSYIGGASGYTIFGKAADAGTLTEFMRIDSTGNVGIGYSSGTEINNNRLAVNGSGYFNGIVTVNGLINMKNYTVSTLPAGTRGDKCYVTDALTPTYLVTVVGGGAITTEVFNNGTNWVCT